jgi:hypothetical protein
MKYCERCGRPNHTDDGPLCESCIEKDGFAHKLLVGGFCTQIQNIYNNIFKKVYFSIYVGWDG